MGVVVKIVGAVVVVVTINVKIYTGSLRILKRIMAMMIVLVTMSPMSSILKKIEVTPVILSALGELQPEQN